MGFCLSRPTETGRGRLDNSWASFQFAINDVPTSAESFVCSHHPEYSTVLLPVQPLSAKFHLLLLRPGGEGGGGGHPITLRANLRHRETQEAHGWRPVELLRSCQVSVLTSLPQSCPDLNLSITNLDQNICATQNQQRLVKIEDIKLHISLADLDTLRPPEGYTSVTTPDLSQISQSASC